MTATAEEIRHGLAKLRPDIPWANHYDLGFGIETVTPDAGRFYGKAKGLNEFSAILPKLVQNYMHRPAFEGMRCLDLGSAEGLHGILMGTNGASEVIGIDGRELYVERARFIAGLKGLSNVTFRQADVRALDVKQLGTFDFVLCSGLLHHLNPEAFEGFTRDLFLLSGDTLLLYVHVATEKTIPEFKLRPHTFGDGKYHGALFQEHAEKASTQQRLDQVRASLDNTFSFWPFEETLVERMIEVGFRHVAKVYQPSFVGAVRKRMFRGLWIARRR
jgi:SAM-dependent methyltransferase